MRKLIDYNKFGRGISKSETEKKFGLVNYFKSFKIKFWKILSVNIFFVVCLIPVIALILFSLNNTVSKKNILTEYMFEKGFSSVYVDVIDRYNYAYNFTDDQLAVATECLDKIYNIVNNRNKDVISSSVEDFDINLYTGEDVQNITKYFTDFTKALGFTATYSDSAVTIKESDKDIFIINFDNNEVKISDSIPYSYAKFGMTILCFAPLILLAPAISICFKLTSDYVRGENVFFWHDILDTFKKNWWQSYLIGITQYLLSSILLISLKMYYSLTENGFIYVACFTICLLVAYIFLSMNLYTYLMQVSLKLDLKKIYKNSFLFSIIGMFRNIAVIALTAILALIIVVLFIVGMGNSVVMSITVLALLLLVFGWWFYTTSYIIYPKIQELVVDPYYKQLQEENKEGSTEIDENEDLPEYIYHNGKMIHRSVYEKEVLFKDDVE